MKQRKTDYGTVILHWVLVGSFAVALVSGLRIAAETPEHAWIGWFDAILPHSWVWTAHMPAAIVLVGVAVAYAVYMLRSGLGRRVRLDGIRIRGLFGRPQARWGAINVVLYWIFYGAMLALIGTGGLLYFGFLPGHSIALLHWYAMSIVLGYVALHICGQWALGGIGQLVRICRPTAITNAPPPLDPIELLELLAEHTDPSRAAAREPPQPNPPKNLALQSNPFVVAVAVAAVGATCLVAADREAAECLIVHRIDHADAPVLDGDTSDNVWRNVAPISVNTNHGGNFDGTGESQVDIRAVHDGTWVYFQFAWDDPTRSLKHLPLIKRKDGWHVLHDGFEAGDEHKYNEDKFSVLLTASDAILAGDRTFHAGQQPLSNAPPTLSGHGLHYTTDGHSYADVWQWKATSGGPSGWMDDDHFGPPLNATAMQTRGIVPYKGGFAPDPGGANYSDNFGMDSGGGYQGAVIPRRLPKDLGLMATAMGRIDVNPNHGEGAGARWYMTPEDSLPYTPERDAGIPDGTVIPGVILSGVFSGDRADIQAAARWGAGRWALEVARRLDTGSKFDVPVITGTFMRVGAFDHSQIRHTRHVRPIRIEVE